MNPLFRLLCAFPFKTGIIVGASCFLIIGGNPLSVEWGLEKDKLRDAEFYPLSSFPMYSKFSANPSYLFLTDSADQPLACQAEFDLLASVIKKIYDKKVRIVGKREDTGISKLAQPFKMEAGLATLQTLRDEVARDQIAEKNPGPLRLYEVIIRRGDDGQIEETTTFVGEL